MADEELLQQDEKEQGKPIVVANDSKWTPRAEIRWNKNASARWLFCIASVTFIHDFTKRLLRSLWIRNASKQEEEL